MKKLVPPQHTGQHSETAHSIVATNDKQACQLFTKAKKNLLAINNWHYLSGNLSASFQLLDADAKSTNRAPQKGDYFKIDIPGPGTKKGQGYDWVKVEAIEEENYSEQHIYIAIKVRPTKSPAGEPDASNHFFTSEATSTFSVERKGKKVTAAVIGRNEKPNTKTSNPFSKIRNAVVGFLAMLGFNKPQWKTLVKGILEKDADAATFQE